MTVPPPSSGLLEQLRDALRTRHYSRRTEAAYVSWARRFAIFHGMRDPRQLTPADVSRFVSSLAKQGVSASTQNQALGALLFLYQTVLRIALPELRDIARAKAPQRLPVVLSRGEVASVLGQLHGVGWLMASLLYGCGLRLMECAELRVKDLHFDRGEVVVRDGKGGKTG